MLCTHTFKQQQYIDLIAYLTYMFSRTKIPYLCRLGLLAKTHITCLRCSAVQRKNLPRLISYAYDVQLFNARKCTNEAHKEIGLHAV